MTTSVPPEAPIDIVNMAVDIVGQKVVASIEEPNTDVERLGQRWYDATRRALLREQVWNFAQKYKTIPRAGAAVDGVYADAYNYPNDLIRLNIVGEDPTYPITAYRLAGRQIYASEGSSLSIYYNYDATDVPDFDPLFVDYLALRLAERIAYKLTKKKSVVEMTSGLIKLADPKVSSVDGQERPPIRIQQSKYLNARRQGAESLTRGGKYYYFSDA